MKNTTILTLAVLAAVLLAGCGKQGPDCTKPESQQARDQCAAHKAAIESRGPDTLPVAPKKW